MILFRHFHRIFNGHAIQESKCEIATSWFVDYYEGDDITESKKLDINDVQVLNKEEFYKNFFTRMGS